MVFLKSFVVERLIGTLVALIDALHGLWQKYSHPLRQVALQALMVLPSIWFQGQEGFNVNCH